MLEDHEEVKFLRVFRIWVILCTAIVALVSIPVWKQTFVENRISVASTIISEKWWTRATYEEVWNIWFLKYAFLEKYKKRDLSTREQEFFEKIYDTSIESEVKGKVDVSKYQAWNSNATGILARDENAQVDLKYAEYQSEVLDTINTVKNHGHVWIPE